MEKWLNSVYSDGTKYFVSNPLPKKGEEFEISLRIVHDAPINSIILRTKPNGAQRLITMTKAYTKSNLDYYTAKVKCFENELRYCFYIVASDGVIYYYNQYEITTYIPSEAYDFRILCDYEQPSWVKGSVFYQIFPDRFCNGDEKNDCLNNEYTFDNHPTVKMEWSQAPRDYSEVFCLDFYGGDLLGIEKKINYFKQLGVNALYLNPIFYAATSHKYDCLDYFNVDPHFGGNKALASLTSKLHQANMKIILDVSINHTGAANKWFNKDGEFFDKKYGAYNNPHAKERSYYFFDEDNNYKAWANVPTLPTLNYTSKELRKTIYLSSNSLVKKWLKPPYNIDGWRFDVADVMARNDYLQLHHQVWPEIRSSIKEVNPNALILAEDWSDCSEFFNGDEWDSTMNYFGCARPIRQFLGEIDLFSSRNPILNTNYKMTANDLKMRITSYVARLPHVIFENQFNLLDSHDVPRLHNNKKINKLEYIGAVTMMFTLPGAANIYYGDEIDIDGTIDTNEGCRYPMPWDKDITKTTNYHLYQTLAHLKTTEDALINGGFKFIATTTYALAFARFNLENVFITVISSDSEVSYLRFDLKTLGKENTLPATDVFGNPLSFKTLDNEIVLEVKPHQSYLIKL